MALFLITLSWCCDDFRKVWCYALSRNLTMEHLTFKSRNLSLKYMISRQMLLSSIPVSLLPYFHNKGADQTVWGGDIECSLAAVIQLYSPAIFCQNWRFEFFAIGTFARIEKDPLVTASSACLVWQYSQVAFLSS